jgi:anti-sigma B factor antagonist
MALEKWSDRVAMARPASDAQLGEDIGGVEEMLAHAPVDVVVDFSEMTFLGSTDLARLIALRKKLIAAGTKLVLCGVPTQLHGTFQVTGLTKIFSFADNISTALASLQMGGAS